MISYSTNYFKAFFFEAIVTVNLTAMLVLTTLFINVSNSLPPTSYLKMIDVYLIFSLLIPFLEPHTRNSAGAMDYCLFMPYQRCTIIRKGRFTFVLFIS